MGLKPANRKRVTHWSCGIHASGRLLIPYLPSKPTAARLTSADLVPLIQKGTPRACPPPALVVPFRIALSTHPPNLRYELCSLSSPRRDKHERLLDRFFIGRAVFSPLFVFRHSARCEGYARRVVSSLVQSQEIQSAKTDQSRPKIRKRSARLDWRSGSKTDPSVASARNLAAGQKLAGCLLVV